VYAQPSLIGRTFSGIIDYSILNSMMDIAWKMSKLLLDGKITSLVSTASVAFTLYMIFLRKGYTIGKLIMRYKVVRGPQDLPFHGLPFIAREIISKRVLIVFDFFACMFTGKSITDRVFGTNVIK